MGLPSPRSIEENASALVRGWQAIARLVGADHATIQSRTSRVDVGGADDFKLHVAVAPARRLRGQQLPRRTEACQFAQATFAKQVAVDYSSTTFLRLRVIEERPYPGTVCFHPNALIEAVFNLSHSTTRGGDIVLNVLDILEPISQLARAVRSGSHAGLFSYRRRRRLDWFVNVSSTVSSDRGPRPWTELEFPGREPSGHTGQGPFTPVSGLVPGKIRGLSPRAGPDRFERVVTEGFLEDNGYDGTDWAVADALEALEVRISQEAHVDSHRPVQVKKAPKRQP